jgi:hypothetical protein
MCRLGFWLGSLRQRGGGPTVLHCQLGSAQLRVALSVRFATQEATYPCSGHMKTLLEPRSVLGRLAARSSTRSHSSRYNLLLYPISSLGRLPWHLAGDVHTSTPVPSTSSLISAKHPDRLRSFWPLHSQHPISQTHKDGQASLPFMLAPPILYSKSSNVNACISTFWLDFAGILRFRNGSLLERR